MTYITITASFWRHVVNGVGLSALILFYSSTLTGQVVINDIDDTGTLSESEHSHKECCHALSNVNQGIAEDVDGGVLTGGPYEICVDGTADNIMDIVLSDNEGENSQWVVTDLEGNILGLPPSPEAVDFDGAGVGTCLIWHLSYSGAIMGLEMGNNTSMIEGCYDLSNSVTVIRSAGGAGCDENCEAEGGLLEGGPFEFCVDGEADMVSGIILSDNVGSNNQWVVTDPQGNILGLPPSPEAVDFDGAGAGTCFIWNLSSDGNLDGLMMGNNIYSDISGCYSLSTPVTVIRRAVEGGSLTGGPFEFCVDGEADMVSGIGLSDNVGENSQWVITDEQGNILGLPPSPEVVNFDGAGPGVCLIWHMSYSGEISGAEMGNNASMIEGCFALSNSIRVTRNEANGGVLTGGPYEICVDGTADNIMDIGLSDNVGENSQWVVTDLEGNILGLPPSPEAVDFDGAGIGTCLIWHLSYYGSLTGADMGNNASMIEGCYDLSNSVVVIRSEGGVGCEENCEAEGGILEGGPFEFCVDGEADMVSGITLSANIGENSQWIVTDPQGNILGLPPSPEAVDFDGAGAGTCFIWNLSSDGSVDGIMMGNNIYTDMDGCYSLSNPVTVIRRAAEGGVLTGGPFEFCVDGEADMVSGIGLSDNTGENSQWVITDEQGNILGLPPSPELVNFDGAGPGVCLIWHMSYSGAISGAEVGNNASMIEGCFSLSNSIRVTRNQTHGGELTLEDGELLNRVIIANRASGTISVIDSDTDEVLETIALPDSGEPMYAVYNSSQHTVLVGDYGGKVVAYDAIDFSLVGSADAGEGVFHMWLSPDNQQLWVNNEIDNTISVIDPNNLQNISTFPIPMDLNDGGFKPHDVIVDEQYAYVTFLGPLTEDVVVKYSRNDFSELARALVGLDPHVSLNTTNDYLYVASQGSSEVAVLNRSDLSEVAVLNVPNAHGLGMNNSGSYLYVGNISNGGTEATYTIETSTNTLSGTAVDAPFSVPHNYAVSKDDTKLYITHSGGMNNQVSVYSVDPTPSLLGSITVENNPFGLVAYSVRANRNSTTICAGDGMADNFMVSVDGNVGDESQWVVTDTQGNILGLPPSPEAVDFDGAGPGVCLIWHLSYSGAISGLDMGNNVSMIDGCFSLSDSVEIIRNEPDGGVLMGGPYEICVDGTPDNITDIDLSGEVGENSQWVVTDLEGNILGLPPSPEAVDFDGAGVGTCLIWHLSYYGSITGAEMGNNASMIEGCYDLSNSVVVIRSEDGAGCDENCEAEGGTLEGGPFEFCVDGEADMVSGISLSGNAGDNSQWIVTDAQGNILGLPPSPEAVDFDGAGAGTCFIWNLSSEGNLEGVAMGSNIYSDIAGCYSLSNPVTVIRRAAEGGSLTGGPFEFCVDGEADMVSGIALTGNVGDNSQWVITDDQGNILGLPSSPEVVNFDAAGPGICLIWHLSYSGTITGAEVGNNASMIEGCFSLSNSIQVTRNAADGGVLTGGPFEFCVDGEPDMVSGISLSDNVGENSQWVITDDQGNILGLPPSPEAVNFDEAGPGVCLIWNLSYSGTISGLDMGNNVSMVEGCFSLSNSIEVVRNQPEGGDMTGGPFEFCIDDQDDFVTGVEVANAVGDSTRWIITDDAGMILGLPADPGMVNFNDAGTGVCLIWHASYYGDVTGVTAGMNASDIEGCLSLSNSIVVTRVDEGPACITSTAEIEDDVQFSIYPNPANDQFVIDYDLSSSGEARSIELQDVYGRVIQEISLSSSKGQEEVDVRDMPGGVYYLKLLFGAKIFTKTIVVN